MARITVEDCLQTENNRFALVQLAAKRTKQLLQGSPVRIADRKNKPVVTALREIAANQVRFMTQQEIAEYEIKRQADLEAARAAAELERPRQPAQFLGNALFGNGTTQVAALEESIFKGTGDSSSKGSDDDDEE